MTFLKSLFDAKKDAIEYPCFQQHAQKMLFNHLLLWIYILLPNKNQDVLKVTNDGYSSSRSAETADFHAANIQMLSHKKQSQQNH